MIKGNNIQHELSRLEAVLDTFGAHPERWPVSERRSLETLIEKNPDARVLLNEARALARIMDAAPVSEASSALRSRIVASAIEDTGRNARVVPIEAVRNSKVQSISVRRKGAIWPAAALAASFALGLYLGVEGIGGSAVDDAFEIAMSGISNGGSETISWLEGGASANEDEPL